MRNDAFRAADVVFAIGGGKAIDTVKTAAEELDKTVFSVPTICSNCSSATAIAVVYNLSLIHIYGAAGKQPQAEHLDL